jgi:hypothetical protein
MAGSIDPLKREGKLVRQAIFLLLRKGLVEQLNLSCPPRVSLRMSPILVAVSSNVSSNRPWTNNSVHRP